MSATRVTDVFAALGDETRLEILSRLTKSPRRSISQLTHGTHLTRQAVTKHLRVLEKAGVVHGTRIGRETLFDFDQRPIDRAREYLDRVSAEWDAALLRLKDFVEKD
jgi:DNA-binding transcriptional ArsR family regulator